MESHPSYANSTIVEALCEIQFEPSNVQDWTSSGPAEFFLRVRERYSRFESLPPPIGVIQIVMGGAPNGLASPQAQAALTRYLAVDGIFSCIVGPNVFRVHVTKPYPGWEVLRAEILKLWSEILDLAKPKKISRIGLRYINLLDISERNETVDLFVNPTDSIPANAVRGTLDLPLSSRTEVWTSQHSGRIVQLGNAFNTDIARGLLLDLDRFVQEPAIEESTASYIASVIEEGHNEVWAEFDAACGPKWKEVLSEANP
ncbi:TIGR04255 family protein [Luteibacter sp.]|uniref:TIGR04255 family protein n=1 Tax=Luteibacter sp. TaxID=1886636 RepID=UPI003F7EA1FA